MPWAMASRGERSRSARPSRRISPPVEPVGAEEQPGQLGAAGADQAGEPHDLARAQREVDVSHRPAADAARLEHHLADRSGARRKLPLEGTAHHQLDEPRPVEVRGRPDAHERAVAQDRDAVGEAEDLVEAVAHEDDAQAARPQLGHDAKRRSASRGVSAAVGSSRISRRASASRARAISTSWRTATSRAATGVSGSRSPRPSRASASRVRADSIAGRQPAEAPLAAEEQVGAHGELGDQALLLVHHGHARGGDGRRAAAAQVVPAELDRAGVGALRAG